MIGTQLEFELSVYAEKYRDSRKSAARPAPNETPAPPLRPNLVCESPSYAAVIPAFAPVDGVILT